MPHTKKDNDDYLILESVEILGFVPGRQERSRRSTIALLEAGAAALRQCKLEQLPLETVCRDAGLTVGAFYKRFDSKETFFRTLLFVVTHRRAEEFDALVGQLDFEHESLHALCESVVGFLVDGILRNQGVLRASLERHRAGDADYSPFLRLGAHYKSVLVRRLGPRLPSVPVRQRRRRVEFAYEAVTGTIMHALSVAPGPLGLTDPSFVGELSLMMVAYLERPPVAR